MNAMRSKNKNKQIQKQDKNAIIENFFVSSLEFISTIVTTKIVPQNSNVKTCETERVRNFFLS